MTIPIEASMDPLLSIPNNEENIDARSEQFERQITSVLADMEAEEMINIEGINSILIFGPGLSDAQAVFHAIKSIGNKKDITLNIVEGDSKLASHIGYLEEQGDLPRGTTFWANSFNGFLLGERPENENINADLVVIHDTGPATTAEDLGFSADGITQLVKDVSEGALILLAGETHNLNNLIEESGRFTKIADNIAPTSFEKGVTVWKKTS